MKKLKNKWFYISSFFIYLFLTVSFSILTLMFVESYANSFLISHFAKVSKSQDIVEIVIDDKSIREYKWPWAKSMYTELLDYFYKYTDAKVIGLDVNITSFDKNNSFDIELLKQISKMKNLVVGFTPDQNYKSDNSILKIFKSKYALDVTNKTGINGTNYNDVVSSSLLVDYIPYYGSVKLPVARYSKEVLSAGNIIKVGDAFYPSLSFKMYMLGNNANEIVLDSYDIFVPKTGLKIPVSFVNYDGLVSTPIRFYKNAGNIDIDYSHPTISASFIIDTYRALKSGVTPETNPELYDVRSVKYLNPDLFKNKVVFIGANISGPTADVHKTPMNDRHAGVDIQASIYDNLTSNSFITYAGIGTNFLSFLALSLFAFIIILRSKLVRGLLLILGVDMVFLTLVALCASNGHILSYAVPIVCQLVTTIFGYSFKFMSENRNKEKIKQAMGKYLSQDVMKNVVRNIDVLKLGGKRAVVTVLFSDIRGFTSLSEKMSAEEVSMILNEYFAEMEPIISKYNGVINKFIGDAVMALFGEPIQDSNHAENAVKCAYEMLKKVEYLREKWLFEGKPKIEIGVGINTGEVFIGNIGTETRMEYTVIGDTVNLASRIEGYNKVYKTNLLVSSSTYEYISGIADVIKISEVQIRGKSKKMNIYEVLRIDKNS